jgi:hypothetical protein
MARLELKFIHAQLCLVVLLWGLPCQTNHSEFLILTMKTGRKLFPNIDRLYAAAQTITENSLMKTGIIMGVDPEAIGLNENSNGFSTRKIEEVYSSREVKNLTTALKIYGDYTTGGYNIPLRTIIPVAETWDDHNHGKPVILHLEDEAVGYILEAWPANIPVHIAHVSSKEELEAVIIAKQNGKDVTCEATPHHMFLTEKTRDEIGAFGCMKPSLKPEEDRKFLWDNLEYIDIFASDCAPHRLRDKIGPDGKDLEKPAFGVTNHDVFLPLFFQAILDGKLTEQRLYERIVTNPLKRFNLPFMDSYSSFSLVPVHADEATAYTEYGCSPFTRTSEAPAMRGKLEFAQNTGRFVVQEGVMTKAIRPSYNNLIRY